MERVLLEDTRYTGKYVALRLPTDVTVVSFGDDPSTVREEARRKGVDEPFIFFVSEPENLVVPCYEIGQID